MCLSRIIHEYPENTTEFQAWKIVTREDSYDWWGVNTSYFPPFQKSIDPLQREPIVFNQWIKDKEDYPVHVLDERGRRTGQSYLTGFHSFPTKRQALKYYREQWVFGANKMVVKVKVRDARTEGIDQSSRVIVSREIYYTEEMEYCYKSVMVPL